MIGLRKLWFHAILGSVLVTGASGLSALGATRVQAVSADINITINPSQPVGVSQFAAGLTHIDASLTSATANAGAVASAREVVARSTTFQNNHLMAWGTSDPWPDPSLPGPTNWTSLDRRMALAVETGGTPILTLAHAPWWMKGQRQADGTTQLIPTVSGDFQPVTYGSGVTDFRGIVYPAGYESPSPFDARILDNQMDNWLLLVQRAAERYMAPPYNVRHFQVWNELKGYYNPTTNRWDHDNSAGDPSGYNAQHGYTYMYNQVYARLRQVAASLGIPLSEIKIGGPYLAFKTWSSTGAGGYPTTEPLLMNRPYGTYDQRDVDAIKYWLQHKLGAEFVAWDGGTKNREGVNLVDPYAASEKFWDTVKWVRSLDPGVYPGADTLPIVYAEWYAFPYDANDPQQHNSVKTYAAMRYIQAGGWLTLMWGAEERPDPKLNSSLYTETDSAGGGQPLPWATTYQALQMHFGAGTSLVATTQSSPQVGVLASPAKTMLVNKTSTALLVAVNGVLLALDPYQVLVIDTPPEPAIPTPTDSPTAPPTETQPPSATPTHTATATTTASPTTPPTNTAAATHTPTATASPTTPLPTATLTATASRTPTATAWPTSGDTVPPAVAITKPRDGSTVARSKTVSIVATASDNVQVSAVRFYVNDVLVCTDSAAPFNCAWPVPAPRRIAYTLRAQAWDAAGNQASHSITVTSR